MPTRSPRLRGLFRARGYGTPQGMMRNRENDTTRMRAGARLSGFAACRKLSMWRASRATPCLIALALALSPALPVPFLVNRSALRAWIPRVHHIRSFSLPLQFSRITPSFFLPLLSIFPSSFSVALSLSPKLNLSLFVLEADMLSCSVAASRDRKTFPVLAFLASIYKNLYTESTVLSISTDFPQKLENFPPVYFFSLPYDCFSSPIVYAPPDDSLVRCITYGECAICFAGQATRRLSLPSSLGTRSEPISM